MAGIMRRLGEKRIYTGREERQDTEYKGGALRAIGQRSEGLSVGETAGYAAKSAWLGFRRVGEGVVDAALVPVDLMTGNVEQAKSRFMDSPIDRKKRELEEEYKPGKVAEFIGKVTGGMGQSAGYGLISAIPYAGKPMMYSSIVEQGISSAAEQTGEVGLKEIAYGGTVGVIEGTLESKLGAGVNAVKGIGSAILKKTGLNVAESAAKAGGKSMLKSVLTETAKGFAGEFAEEAISEAVDPALLRLYNIDENAQFSLKDVAYAGLIGGLSGGMMSAGPAAINYRSAVSVGRALQESRLDGGLIKRARYTLSALEAAQARSTGQIKGRSLTAEGDTKETAKEWLSRTSENRKAKRLSKETAQLADKIRRNIQAYENSIADPAMAQSEPVAAILGELRGNLFLVGYAYEADVIEQVMMEADDKQRQAFVDAINEELAAQGKKHDYTLADFDANKDDIRRGLAGRLMMDELQGGTEYGAEAPQKPAQAATSPWDGMADNEDMSVYQATGEAENALLRAAVNQSVPRGSVQAMLDEYRKGTDLTPEEFAAGWSDGAHIYGRYGLNVDEASPLSRMSPEAREAAMKFGRETEEAERKAAEEKAKAKKKPAAQAGKKGTVVRGEGLNVQKLSDEQYAAYKAAEVLAEVLGTDIVIKTKILTNKGKEANGYYDRKDNTIHININALRNGKNVALYTLGHEITHYIKEWSPQKFEALADFVLEKMGVDAETAIADKLASLKRLGVVKDTMTVAEANAMAREELVAEGMELVLTDGKVLTELAKTDKSLWEKIRDWFFDIIGQIRRSWQDLNQASKTSQVLKETVESLEEIERLFTEGVREAGERTRTAEEGETAESDIVYSRNAESGVMIDPASGTAMLSVDDIPKTEQEIDDAVNRLVQKLGVDESRARQWVQNELSLATLILRDDMVDYAHRKADRRLTAIVKNSDYKQGTLDFSNICRKRREYTRMMQRIQQAFPNRRFTAEEFATIRKIMVDEGLEVACGLCYVEDRRQNEGYIAETFQRAVEAWRKGNRDTYYDTKNNVESTYKKGQAKAMAMLEKGDYVPTIADLTTVEGMNKLQAEHKDILQAWKAFNNARGMSSARLLTNEAEYQRQILKYKKDQVKRINDLGGLRIFSFSDFEEFHLLDIIQAVQDCAAMGIKIQFYTKVPSFALLMKDTKAKGNLSLIPKGDLGYEMKNGKRVLVYDPVEGIDFNDPAFKKVARGNPNIGTILVGINDEHIRTAMEDDFIDYIIPFHTGQTEVVRQIKKIGKWQNYKNEQVDKPWDSGSKAKPVNIYTDVIAAAEREGDPIRNERQFVERFLKVCEERGLRPRFSGFLNTNAEGKYVYTKGYYKLLLDFKMFDKDGTYLPQEPVIPEFDKKLLHDLTKKYVAGEKAKTEAESPAFQRALERVEAEVVGDDEGRMYSIDEDSDTAYLAAVERGDMVTAQRMVNEAAKKWGAIVDETTKTKRPLHLYHGSRDFGFTRFNERVIFATVKESVAAGYNSGVGLGRVRNASVKYIPNDGTAETAIKNARSVLGRDLKLLDDKAKQEIISKADAILKTVARKISDIDDAIDYGKAEKFFEYLAGKYGEDASVKWTNQLDNMKYMISGEYTAEEILENGEWLEHDLEKYSEWKRSLNELWLEEREEIENATLGEAFRYVLGYDYGDKVIDIEFGLGRLLNEREKLVNPNGSLVYLDDIIANIEEKKSTGVYDLYGHAGEKPLIIDEGNRFWDAIPFDGGFRSTDYIVKWAKDHGYTSVNLKSIMDPSAGGSENVYADEWVFFSSDQVKSADPVTYDDNGNVIPLSERFKEDDSDIRYSIDETPENADVSDASIAENRDLTDREILGMALEGAVQSQEEYNIVKSYREQASMLELAREKRDGYIKEANALERQIKALRARMEDEGDPDGWIRKAMDDAIAKKREAERMRDEQVKILDNADRELLRMKAAKPFREIVAREQKRVRAAERRAERAEEVADRKVERAQENAEKKIAKEKERMEEQSKQSRERKEITIRMREARRVLGYLNTMLYHPTKQKHVPESLQALVDKALRSADPKQFGINRDHIREMSELAGKIRNLESKAGRTTAEQETLDKMKTKYEKLEADTISVKRQAEALMTAFEQYVTSTTDGEQIDKNMLEGLRQTVTEIEEAPLNEMTLESLKAVEKIYTVIYHQVNTANQAFATEKAASIDEMSTEANTQVKNAKELKFLSPRSREWAALAGFRSFLWKNMKPLTVFEAIGSNKLMEIFRRVLDAEDVWITDILEAKKVLDEAKKEFGYNKWNLKERREVTTADGSKVSLTLGEMMSLYAYMFREQAEEHLSAGGFVFAPNAETIESFKGDKGKYRTHLNDQTTHRMRKEDIAKMSEMMTEEQRAYAKAVQEYLTSLGKKGNEVSSKLYGIDLFKETAYFPIKSSHDYIETSTGKSGDPNIKSRGTFKETVPKAGNPIVLEDFMEVVGNHVNTMATYHAFVLPVEDLTRVWNYTPVNIKRDENGKAILDKNGMPVADTEGEAGYNSLKAEITKKYGKEANDYILQLLRDLNGGARRESAASILDKGLTAFKRSATMLSLSTIVQQPTSIIRAMAYVEAKYFTGASFVPWETVKKYAPVAAIKEMGGFDTGTGARTTEYINAKQYDSIKDAAKAAVTPEIYGGDPNVRAEAFGWMTGKADEVSWRYMFGAIVNEQAEKLGKAKDSEEVLKAAGKRFAEVVRRTQVYDSTLTRSEFMRSKDGLMKMATAFGAEPTTILSMAAEAIVKLERGDKAFFRKTAGAVAASILVNAVISSIIYAMRDDDEEKNILEKYTESVTSEIIEGFNPLEYLPIARDVMSIFKGYDIERTDMSLISNLYQQIELLTSSKRSPADKIAGVSGAVGAFFGLPITNVYRDAKGIVLTTAGILDPEPVTGRGMGNAVGQGIKGQAGLLGKIFGKERGDSYELYKAYVKGDKAHYNRVAARYKTEADLEYALRRELRENDKRIVEAAEARLSGDLAVYESLVDQIESEGIFDRNIVIRAINNEVSEIRRAAEKGELVPKDETATDEEETPESLYTASDLNAALERGDAEDFAAILAALVEDKVSTGKTEAQAKSSVKSSITAYWKKQYLSGYRDTETRKRIIKLLTETGLYGSRNDVATMCEGWVKASK